MAFAQLFCCVLSFIFGGIFHYTASEERAASLVWIVLAGFPLITILAQSAILFRVYPYETVKYLSEKG
jgi:hypothetical protein